jgi:hypothetical protein
MHHTQCNQNSYTCKIAAIKQINGQSAGMIRRIAIVVPKKKNSKDQEHLLHAETALALDTLHTREKKT